MAYFRNIILNPVLINTNCFCTEYNTDDKSVFGVISDFVGNILDLIDWQQFFSAFNTLCFTVIFGSNQYSLLITLLFHFQ